MTDTRWSLKKIFDVGAGKTLPTITGWAENLGFFLKPVHGDQGKIWNRYVLLLDINLPKVHGIEVLRKIKEHDMLKKVPALMLSTTDNPQEVETC